MVSVRWVVVMTATVACAVGVFLPGLSIYAATDPKDVLRTAVDTTRQATSVHAEAHTTASTPAPSGADVRWTANLAGSDSDITIQNPKITTRTVAVADKVYQQAPVTPGAGWQVTDRQAVPPDAARGTALMGLTFPDGRSAGDASLYRSVTNSSAPPGAAVALPLAGGLLVHTTASADTTPPVKQTLIAELDMLQIGLALRVGAKNQASLVDWRGTVTVTVGPDGRIARQQLTLRGPSPAPGLAPFSMTHDVSYSQFNATSVVAPVQP